MKNSCEICGKPSGMYPLCPACFKLRDEGKIAKCETCGTWFRTNKGCPNCKPQKNITHKIKKSIETTEKITCLICGKSSNGAHLCVDCYNRYKNKKILLQITKCIFPCGDPLDKSYEGVYQCDDGHIVKSTAEQTIDNYLYEHEIFHGYELPLDVGTDKPLHPDFCLKDYLGKGKNVYLEYFGRKGQQEYDEETAYKINLYRKKHITVICMYPKTDSKNLNFALSTKLKREKLKEGALNYYED